MAIKNAKPLHVADGIAPNLQDATLVVSNPRRTLNGIVDEALLHENEAG
ncbi:MULTISPECIES: hypothetical protein [Bradyrhizobium]|nr:hypothetical protein [Bradyrhizobium elkanii]